MLRAAGTTVEWWLDQHRQLSEWVANHPDEREEIDRRVRKFLSDVETLWFARRKGLPPCVAGRVLEVDAGSAGHLTIGLFKGRLRVVPLHNGPADVPDWWGGGRSLGWYRLTESAYTFALIPDLLVAVEAAALTHRL